MEVIRMKSIIMLLRIRNRAHALMKVEESRFESMPKAAAYRQARREILGR